MPNVPPSPVDRPPRAVPRSARMVRWAGRLVVLYGAAHTLGALTVEGAARHAGAWFGGELRGDDLADMSPANSAWWLSVMSFGPQLVLVGFLVLWLARRGIAPPRFIAWFLGTWTLVDAAIAGLGSGQGVILLLAVGLLVAGTRRPAQFGGHAPVRPLS